MGRRRRDTGKSCIRHFPFRWAVGHPQYSGDLPIVGEMCISLQGSFKLCWLDFHHSFHYSLGQKQSNKGSCLLSADFEAPSPVLLSPFVRVHACCSRNIIHSSLSESGLCWVQGCYVSGAMSLVRTCFLDWAPAHSPHGSLCFLK